MATDWRQARQFAFIGATGHRCNERRFVEFHHLDPCALGGGASVDQVELRCRPHNDYEGRLYFGKRRRHGRGGVREAGAVRDGAIPHGEQPVERASDVASLFRNELTCGKGDDGRSGTLPRQA